MKDPVHYVNNKEFLQLLIDYRAKVAEAEKNGKKRPVVPDAIGGVFIRIANRLATKNNFSSYTYKDEMIGDGIENCITYVLNFDPEKSDNPFAYFTQIIYNAFIRRIQREKKQTYLRFKSLENSRMFDKLSETQDHESQSDFVEYFGENINMVNKMSDFIRDFEQSSSAKKKKKVQEEAEATNSKMSEFLKK